jgi:hypothetical protein
METGDKILERMRRTKFGWGQCDFERLLTHFGFAYREGRDRVYYHPKYRQLLMLVARHGELKPAYARQAVKLIDELKRLEAEDEGRKNDSSRSKTP